MDDLQPTTPQRSIDDIVLMVPGVSGEEYDVRAKLRGYRNAMTALLARTESDTARSLAWIVTEYATATVYSPANLDYLKQVAQFCYRVSLCAMQAEDLDG